LLAGEPDRPEVHRAGGDLRSRGVEQPQLGDVAGGIRRDDQVVVGNRQ
jgi:hypothetical protein